MTVSEALHIFALPVHFSELDLKKAYREKMLVWHPDRFHGNDSLKGKATHHAALINHAKSVLDAHLTASQDGLPQKRKEPVHFKTPKKTRVAAPHFTPYRNTHYIPKRRRSRKQKPQSRKSASPSWKSWLRRHPGKAMACGAALFLFAGVAVGVVFHRVTMALSVVLLVLSSIGMLKGLRHYDQKH
jgi:hypothetical protein